jgi:DNA-binding transcriptional ArsR family regulator
MDVQLRAVTNSTRREILRCLSAGELSAGAIASRFQQTRPAISHHLGLLRESGLITMRRKAQSRLYSIRPEAVIALRTQFDEFWDVALPLLKKVVEADVHGARNKNNE